MEEKFLNLKQCAKEFNRSTSSIRNYIKKGLPHFWVGGRLAFYESSVKKYFENQTEKKNFFIGGKRIN